MPVGYGLSLSLGGGPDDIEVAQNALLEVLRPYLAATDPAQIALTNAEATAIAITWAVNRRLSGMLDPHRMIETLPTWEQACGMRPAPTDTDTDRRKALAAQFLGYVGNTIANLSAICTAIGGASFTGLYVPSANVPTYTPGLNPGPSGRESSSNRPTIGVRLRAVTTTDAGFLSMLRNLNRTLNLVCPAWMTWVVGTDETHMYCDTAVVDRTLLN